MRQKLFLLFFVACSFVFTGCFEFIETVKLNKDGSGDFTLKIDMSSVMENEFLKTMIQSGIEENMDSEDGENSDFSMEDMEMDSLIYFSDAPAEVKEKFSDKPGLLDRISMRTKMSDKESKLFFDIMLAFKEVDEIDFLFENLSDLMAGSETGTPELDGLLPSVGKDGLYKLSKGKLQRFADASSESMSDMAGEEMEMMKMMMADATYTTIYHFPGKVKKVSNPNSEFEKGSKTVTTTVGFLDMIEGKANIDNMVKFKPK